MFKKKTYTPEEVRIHKKKVARWHATQKRIEEYKLKVAENKQ